MNEQGMKIVNFNATKWLKICVGVLLGILVVRLIAFGLFLGTLGNFFTSFNQYFVAEKGAIHNKIDDSDRDFQRRVAEFDRGWEPVMFDFEKERLKKDNKWGLQGKEFANNIIAEKRVNDAKIAACEKDSQCKYYLKYPESKIADEYQVKLVQCMGDAECRKLLKN